MNFSEHEEYYFSVKDLRRGNCLSLSIASSPRQDVLKNTKIFPVCVRLLANQALTNHSADIFATSECYL